MKNLLALTAVMAMPSFAASGGDLSISDPTGISFWLVTAAMLAATVFFFVERDNVNGKWKTTENDGKRRKTAEGKTIGNP